MMCASSDEPRETPRGTGVQSFVCTLSPLLIFQRPILMLENRYIIPRNREIVALCQQCYNVVKVSLVKNDVPK